MNEYCYYYLTLKNDKRQCCGENHFGELNDFAKDEQEQIMKENPKWKPTVHYLGEPEIGCSNNDLTKLFAWVYALDHPKLGTGTVRTSLMISKHENGFETLNTIYAKLNPRI